MIKLVADASKANEFIDEMLNIVEKHKLIDKFEISSEGKKLIFSVDVSELLEVGVVSLDINDQGKETKPQPQPKAKEKKNTIEVKSYIDLINSLNKESIEEKIKLAASITGLSKNLITRIYNHIDKFYYLDDDQYAKLCRLSETDDETKNMIMIRRIIRTKKTSDPKIIADTIMKSKAIREQTTFTDANSIIQFIEKYGIK